MEIGFVEIPLPVRKRPGNKRRFRVDDGQPLDLRERSGQRLFVRFAGLVREIGRFQIVQRLVFERQHAPDERLVKRPCLRQRLLQRGKVRGLCGRGFGQKPAALQAVGLAGKFFALRQLQRGIDTDELLAVRELVGGVGLKIPCEAAEVRHDAPHRRALGQRTVFRRAGRPVRLRKPPDEAEQEEAEKSSR